MIRQIFGILLIILGWFVVAVGTFFLMVNLLEATIWIMQGYRRALRGLFFAPYYKPLIYICAFLIGIGLLWGGKKIRSWNVKGRGKIITRKFWGMLSVVIGSLLIFIPLGFIIYTFLSDNIRWTSRDFEMISFFVGVPGSVGLLFISLGWRLRRKTFEDQAEDVANVFGEMSPELRVIPNPLKRKD